MRQPSPHFSQLNPIVVAFLMNVAVLRTQPSRCVAMVFTFERRLLLSRARKGLEIPRMGMVETETVEICVSRTFKTSRSAHNQLSNSFCKSLFRAIYRVYATIDLHEIVRHVRGNRIKSSLQIISN